MEPVNRRPASSSAFCRLGKRVIICVLLGAALQYLVAAGFGLCGSYGEPHQAWVFMAKGDDVAARLAVSTRRSVGRDVLTGTFAYVTPKRVEPTSLPNPHWRRGEWIFDETRETETLPRGRRVPSTPPSWSRIARIHTDPIFLNHPNSPLWLACIEVGCGWPVRSASYFAGEPLAGGPIVVREGFVASKAAPAPGSLPRVIPLTVHWPGVIVNTLVYASVLLVPVNLVPWIRVHHRRSAGRCVACGYDLRSNVSGVCPECGNG